MKYLLRFLALLLSTVIYCSLFVFYMIAALSTIIFTFLGCFLIFASFIFIFAYDQFTWVYFIGLCAMGVLTIHLPLIAHFFIGFLEAICSRLFNYAIGRTETTDENQTN